MWVFAQNKTVEGLKKELAAAKTDTIKSDLYYKLALELQRTDPVASQKMAGQSFAIARKHEYYKGIANYYSFVGLQQQGVIKQLTLVKNEALITLAFLLLLSFFAISALFYSRSRLKQRVLLQAQILNTHELMTRAVISAEEQERRRLAAHLRSKIDNLFFAIRTKMAGTCNSENLADESNGKIARDIMALMDESHKEICLIAHQLMPNALLRAGIASDLESFVLKFNADKLKINIDAQGFNSPLESNVETMLYRIIQETINNVIKHAQATQLDIDLNHNNSVVKATIKDNGVGFDTDKRESFDGIGLKNIMTRIDYLKGNIAYNSSPGKGTTVSILIPLA